MARDYMRDHIERLPLVVPARVGRTWSAYRPFQMAKIADAEGRPRWISLTGWGVYWVLMGFAVAGVVTLRRKRVALIPLLAPAVIVTLVSAVFYGLVRFRAPAEVSIVVLAAVALDAAWARRVAAAEPSRLIASCSAAPRAGFGANGLDERVSGKEHHREPTEHVDAVEERRPLEHRWILVHRLLDEHVQAGEAERYGRADRECDAPSGTDERGEHEHADEEAGQRLD
jgi:hypothetical protein